VSFVAKSLWQRDLSLPLCNTHHLCVCATPAARSWLAAETA